MAKVQIPINLLQNPKQPLLMRKIVIFITFVVVSVIIYYYIHNKQNVPINTPSKNISCHYINKGDALLSVEDWNFSPKPNSIFFLETSCRGGLNSRQACVIESASRAHPRRQVYVMFSAPVSDDVYRRSCIGVLKLRPNVKFARIHINDYVRNTPLEDLIASNPFEESKWPVEHTSDILRFLTLYKWGGVYLDTDMLVVKSLTPLGHNWVARHDGSTISAAAIAFSLDHLGRKVAETVINEVDASFVPQIENYAQYAIAAMLAKICETHNLTEWSSNTCKGLEVYGPEYFYPINFNAHEYYFESGELRNDHNAYTHHFWNKISYEKKIEKDSPYDKLAREFCPKIYEMYGEEFGS